MQLIFLAFIALKSWIRQLVTQVKNLPKTKTQLNEISFEQKCISNAATEIMLKSQYIKFLNKTYHCYNCSTNMFSFGTINNFNLYPLLVDKKYCNNDSDKSFLD